jgi:putative flippase GtrA
VVVSFSSFVLVGALATALQYCILVILVTGFSWPPIAASSAGFTISAVVNYTLNYHLTFRSSVPHSLAFTRFTAVAAAGLALNGVVMWMMQSLGMHYLAAQLLATGLVLIWNYTANARWSYR